MIQRKLVAILAADVAGYTRLMDLDEAGTLQRLQVSRRNHFDPEVARFGGRVVKLMGDGALVDFPSVVDAVSCAIAIQKAIAGTETDLAEDRRILYRIGVNVGDVIIEGDDIYGEGVNVAARLEALAEPGGICVSGKVHDELRNKLEAGFEDLGYRELKNIAEPVRVYRVALEGQSRAIAARTMRASGKPTIAVLPFSNMSGDPEQEYFADGISEDILTELSRFKNLFVVARNSSFRFKGQTVKIGEVGRELGAQYVLEGSVRKAGSRVRVTAQLIEVATENHLWAERYDRGLEDIFAVQDEVVHAIAGVIPGQVDRHALEDLRRQPPDNLAAYDCELHGRWAFFHFSEGVGAAIGWYEKAVAADPGYAVAHAGLAMCYAYGVYALGLPPEMALSKAREHAERAVALDDRNPMVNAYAAEVYHLSGEHKLAVAYGEKAVSLNPNDSVALAIKGNTLCYSVDPAKALEWYAKSAAIDPYAPDDQRLDCVSDCYYMLREYDKVLEIHSTYQNRPAFLFVVLAAACAQLGLTENVKEAMEKSAALRPAELDVTKMIGNQMRMCARPEDRDHWLEGYRKAGFDV